MPPKKATVIDPTGEWTGYIGGKLWRADVSFGIAHTHRVPDEGLGPLAPPAFALVIAEADDHITCTIPPAPDSVLQDPYKTWRLALAAPYLPMHE